MTPEHRWIGPTYDDLAAIRDAADMAYANAKRRERVSDLGTYISENASRDAKRFYRIAHLSRRELRLRRKEDAALESERW